MLCPNIRKGILSINLKWRYKIESPISMREQSKRKMANWFLVIYTYWMTPCEHMGPSKVKKNGDAMLATMRPTIVVGVGDELSIQLKRIESQTETMRPHSIP